VLLISHDLGVVAGLADRVVVMYAGRLVECGSTARMLRRPAHPYTAELLKCVPDLEAPRLARMPTLTGQAPGPQHSPRGCAFAPRCLRAVDRCRDERPTLDADAASVDRVACHFPLDR
jgi:oligopeptide/dipeptide ABC transporter ATP-binding protein